MSLTVAQRQAMTWAALMLVAALLLWLLAPVLAPFIVGAVLAYMLHPLVEWLAARRVPRVLAVLIVVVFAILLFLLLLFLVVPVIAKEMPLLREQFPLMAERLNRTVVPWLANYGVNIALDPASVKAFVAKTLGANMEEWAAAVLNSAAIGGSFVLTLLGNAVLMPVVLFYLLLDWINFTERLYALVPPRMRETVLGFLEECDAVLGQYLRGQLLVMLLLAAYYSIGLALFRFDLALPVGVFTGLFVFIPYLGFGLGLALALIAGVLQFGSWYGVIAVAVVYGVGQLIESFALTPRLVGERIGLNPLAVIFALLAFGQLFGFVGVLIALPVSALGLVGLRRAQALYLQSQIYRG